MDQDHRRNVWFISLSQFGVALGGNFVKVILPFYVLKVSPYPPQETLLWIGAIVGSSHLVTAVASNFWGSLTSRYSPKLLYMRGLSAHMIIHAWMGFTMNLKMLLLLRIVQGFMGGISTIGLIIVSTLSSRERISADIGFFQTFLTLGLLLGPPMGSFAASAFGYRGAFLAISVFLAVVLVFCHFYVTDPPLKPKKEKFLVRSTLNRQTILAWLLCFFATVQLMFLPVILPNVFKEFHIEETAALNWAGILVMLYTGTATLGTFVWTRWSVRFGRDRMILFLVLSGTLCQGLLSFSRGLFDFTLIRVVQTGLIAACAPLVISVFATEMKGLTIGFLNSARFAGNAAGPMIATSILAFSNLTTLYLFIAGLTLVTFVGFRLFSKEPQPPPTTPLSGSGCP
jgi:DHA1 family multidrug resistance protein-like MFS transporter